MRKLILSLTMIVLILQSQAQTPTKANYKLASRFSPKKLDKMVFSTSVDPHWLKKTSRFWYTYETTNGKNWYIVDPVKAEKRLLFKNDKLAAQLSNVVKDPIDAQHLNIDSLRFVRDENWIQFQLTSSQDSVIKDTAAKKGSAQKTEKKKYYFEYNINNGGPAPEKITDAIYARTKVIDTYKIADFADVNLDRIGKDELPGGMILSVLDSVEDYTALMEELFDFPAIRNLISLGFRIAFDAMSAVTGCCVPAMMPFTASSTVTSVFFSILSSTTPGACRHWLTSTPTASAPGASSIALKMPPLEPAAAARLG